MTALDTLFDPPMVRDGDSTEDAVFIGRTPTGTTVIVGREDRDETITTNDMVPLDLSEVR